MKVRILRNLAAHLLAEIDPETARRVVEGAVLELADAIVDRLLKQRRPLVEVLESPLPPKPVAKPQPVVLETVPELPAIAEPQRPAIAAQSEPIPPEHRRPASRTSKGA